MRGKRKGDVLRDGKRSHTPLYEEYRAERQDELSCETLKIILIVFNSNIGSPWFNQKDEAKKNDWNDWKCKMVVCWLFQC